MSRANERDSVVMTAIAVWHVDKCIDGEFARALLERVIIDALLKLRWLS